MYIYIERETSKNYNKLSECISDLLQGILFQLCVIILKISFLMYASEHTHLQTTLNLKKI